jgi:hypothetical protein
MIFDDLLVGGIVGYSFLKDPDGFVKNALWTLGVLWTGFAIYFGCTGWVGPMLWMFAILFVVVLMAPECTRAIGFFLAATLIAFATHAWWLRGICLVVALLSVLIMIKQAQLWRAKKEALEAFQRAYSIYSPWREKGYAALRQVGLAEFEISSIEQEWEPLGDRAGRAGFIKLTKKWQELLSNPSAIENLRAKTVAARPVIPIPKPLLRSLPAWKERQHLGDEDEELVEKCIEIIRQEKRASTSLLQRRLGIDFTLSALIIDILEQGGILGPGEGAKPREILVDLG